MLRFIYRLIPILFAPVLAWSCGDAPLAGTDLKTGEWTSVETKSAAKGTVVLFLSAKCPCSESHEETLGGLAKEFPEFKFVGVHSNGDETLAEAKAHFARSKFAFPVLQDKETQIADSFGALKTPHAYIVGPQGECWYNGGVDNSKDATKATEHYLKAALLDLRKGQAPKVKNARTLGCIIKRS